MTLKLERLQYLDWEPISLEIASSKIVSVLGDSGAGKSLLLRSVADLIPWAGKAFLGEKECREFEPSEWRSSVAYLAAEILWWEESVGLHFEMPPSSESLARIKLPEECLRWSPHRLSMGERQRLGLLRLLDRQPKALLLDEPTANLNESAVADVESVILEYVESHEIPALWVTHSLDQAKRVTSDIFRMENKRLRRVPAL